MQKQYQDWVTEIENGLLKAIKISEEQDRDIHYIYLYAISHAIESLLIEDLDTIQEIEEYIDQMIDEDWSLDSNSKKRFKFHYAYSYIFSHVVAKKLDEMEADRIMDYVNEQINLFK